MVNEVNEYVRIYQHKEYTNLFHFCIYNQDIKPYVQHLHISNIYSLFMKIECSCLHKFLDKRKSLKISKIVLFLFVEVF
jgi:hypothetical protein